MEYETGLTLANEIIALLDPFCERIEIAGGLRRKKPSPHDIEIVLAPKYLPGIDGFGSTDYENEVNTADATIQKLIKEGVFQNGEPDKAGKRAPAGPKYYRLKFKGEKVDIFSVIEPAQWGTVFLIRTGDADFSHSFVLRLWKFGLRSRDGHIETDLGPNYAHEILPTPEESDCFELADMPYIEPEKRTIEIFKTLQAEASR